MCLNNNKDKGHKDNHKLHLMVNFKKNFNQFFTILLSHWTKNATYGTLL